MAVIPLEMVNLQGSDSAVASPKPKYGHLSEIDPQFALVKEAADQSFVELWKLPLDEFKAAWLAAPVPLPEDAPQLGVDYTTTDEEIAVRDGTKIGIRIYRPIKPVKNATLVLKVHGGGKYVCFAFVTRD